MDLDANVATFLEFQKVVQNLNTFELSSQSLGYVISKEAVQWNKNFQEVEDEGGNKEYNEQLRKRQVAFDLYDSLQSIVSHLSASVQACCGGTLSGYSRYFDVGQFGNLGTQFSFYDKDVEQLCTPAPFGDLSSYKTVYDPTVRTALECPAEKLNFSLDQVSIKVIQNAIEQNLTRGYKVKLRPYKVNIYKEGGFFKGHVDTPREGMVGTLVLFGAHEHTGGELVVYHNNTSRTFKAVPNPGKDELSWAAFFSDCVHEVLPVKSGKRVSLTFDILLEESISPEIRLRDENSDLLELISTIDNSPVECLGLLLTFKYTLDNINNSHLKGVDKVIADAVARKWKCSLLPVIYKTHEISESMSPEQDDEYWSMVYPFTKEDFLYYATKELSKRPLHGLKNIPFYVFEETGVTLKSKEKQVNYTGNEAEYFLVEKIYLHAALIIDKRPNTTSHIVWSPQNHRKFSRAVRQQVKCIIMLSLIKPDGKPWHPESSWWKLPTDVLHFIIRIVLDDYIDLTYYLPNNNVMMAKNTVVEKKDSQHVEVVKMDIDKEENERKRKRSQ